MLHNLLYLIFYICIPLCISEKNKQINISLNTTVRLILLFFKFMSLSQVKNVNADQTYTINRFKNITTDSCVETDVDLFIPVFLLLRLLLRRLLLLRLLLLLFLLRLLLRLLLFLLTLDFLLPTHCRCRSYCCT